MIEALSLLFPRVPLYGKLSGPSGPTTGPQSGSSGSDWVSVLYSDCIMSGTILLLLPHAVHMHNRGEVISHMWRVGEQKFHLIPVCLLL